MTTYKLKFEPGELVYFRPVRSPELYNLDKGTIIDGEKVLNLGELYEVEVCQYGRKTRITVWDDELGKL